MANLRTVANLGRTCAQLVRLELYPGLEINILVH